MWVAMLTGLLGLPVILLLAGPASELLALLRRARGSTRRTVVSHGGSPLQPRLLFLIPAHNEQLLISACVRSVLKMDYPADRLEVVVIADNSSDATAALARAAGAKCLERTDADFAGKPRAIAWALGKLSLSDHDCCVILDADTTVAPDTARALAAHAPLNDKVLQAYFGLANEEDSWLTRLAGVLTRVRYEMEYPLKQAVGLNCPLTGNGMCFGTAVLQRRGWTAFSLTENWEMYAQLTAEGQRIDFAGDALLFSEEATSLDQARTQRRRWLAGRLGVAFGYTPRLLRSRRIRPHQKLDALAELWSPSPALHVVLAVVLSTCAWLSLAPPLREVLWILIALSFVQLITKTVLVARRHPQPAAILRAFLRLPGYIAWRAFIALRTILTIGDRRWRRTERRATRPSLDPR